MSDLEIIEIETELALLTPGEWRLIVGRREPLRWDVVIGPIHTYEELMSHAKNRTKPEGFKQVCHFHMVTPNWYELNDNEHDMKFICKAKERISALIGEVKKTRGIK